MMIDDHAMMVFPVYLPELADEGDLRAYIRGEIVSGREDCQGNWQCPPTKLLFCAVLLLQITSR
jgi:hypothetical protein